VPERNLKLTIAYDGTRFVGWQRQLEGESIQGLLEEALSSIEGGPVTVHGAGRTDAGVHALGQVASAAVTFSHDAQTLLRALNAQLPSEIRVIRLEDVGREFHARFGATRKTYRYLICHDPVIPPFHRAFAWHLPEPLDLVSMQDAARLLIGTHDFGAFRSTGTPVRTTVRTLSDSRFQRYAADLALAPDLSHLAYEITGDGFLRHMVRAIVGTLVDVGRRRRSPDSIALLLENAGRADAGPTAPAHGLFLVRVDYD
jgi:tRNA pseudouridine38-40 synthase